MSPSHQTSDVTPPPSEPKDIQMNARDSTPPALLTPSAEPKAGGSSTLPATKSPPQNPSETLPSTLPDMLANCFQHLNPEDTIKTIRSLIHVLQATETLLLQNQSSPETLKASYLDVTKNPKPDDPPVGTDKTPSNAPAPPTPRKFIPSFIQAKHSRPMTFQIFHKIRWAPRLSQLPGIPVKHLNKLGDLKAAGLATTSFDQECGSFETLCREFYPVDVDGYEFAASEPHYLIVSYAPSFVGSKARSKTIAITPRLDIMALLSSQSGKCLALSCNSWYDAAWALLTFLLGGRCGALKALDMGVARQFHRIICDPVPLLERLSSTDFPAEKARAFFQKPTKAELLPRAYAAVSTKKNGAVRIVSLANSLPKVVTAATVSPTTVGCPTVTSQPAACPTRGDRLGSLSQNTPTTAKPETTPLQYPTTSSAEEAQSTVGCPTVTSQPAACPTRGDRLGSLSQNTPPTAKPETTPLQYPTTSSAEETPTSSCVEVTPGPPAPLVRNKRCSHLSVSGHPSPVASRTRSQDFVSTQNIGSAEGLSTGTPWNNSSTASSETHYPITATPEETMGDGSISRRSSRGKP